MTTTHTATLDLYFESNSLPEELNELKDEQSHLKSRHYWVQKDENARIVSALLFATPPETIKRIHCRELIATYPRNLEDIKIIALIESYIELIDPVDFAIPKSIFSRTLHQFENSASWEALQDGYYSWFSPTRSYYSYKISSPYSSKYYFGIKTIDSPNASKKHCLNDNYWGSGGNKFQSWKKKYASTMEKEIIRIFPKRYLAYEHEKKLVGDSWKLDPLCLNSAPGGKLPAAPPIRIRFSKCRIHGETKHIGDKCYLCRESHYTLSSCSTHGETIHIKGNKEGKIGLLCLKCNNAKIVSMKKCSIHGVVKHRGDTCYNCTNSNSITVKECKKHGSSKHIADMCCSCKAMTGLTLETCKIHGTTSFWWGKCSTCQSQSAVSLKTCSIHGKTKHRGKTCYKCIAEKTKHKIHIGKGLITSKDCNICSVEVS